MGSFCVLTRIPPFNCNNHNGRERIWSTFELIATEKNDKKTAEMKERNEEIKKNRPNDPKIMMEILI